MILPKIKKEIKLPKLPQTNRSEFIAPKMPRTEKTDLKEIKNQIVSELRSFISDEVRRITPKEFDIDTKQIVSDIRKMIKDGADGKDGISPEIDYKLLVDKVIEGIKNLQGGNRLNARHIEGLPVYAPKMGSKRIDFNDMRWHGSGGTSSANTVSGETPSGTINGINTTFTVANTPVSGTFKVFIDGVRLDNTGYTLTGTTLVVGLAPTSQIVVDYNY